MMESQMTYEEIMEDINKEYEEYQQEKLENSIRLENCSDIDLDKVEENISKLTIENMEQMYNEIEKGL
jgi:predicted transcriptional regulator